MSKWKMVNNKDLFFGVSMAKDEKSIVFVE
jgi:hypothetical protein